MQQSRLPKNAKLAKPVQAKPVPKKDDKDKLPDYETDPLKGFVHGLKEGFINCGAMKINRGIGDKARDVGGAVVSGAAIGTAHKLPYHLQAKVDGWQKATPGSEMEF